MENVARVEMTPSGLSHEKGCNLNAVTAYVDVSKCLVGAILFQT